MRRAFAQRVCGKVSPDWDDIARMVRLVSVRLAALVCLLTGSGWAAEDEGWASLKPGLTRTETVSMLGREILGSRGRGFEITIYEGRAEMVFLNGSLVAWTAPAASMSGAPIAENTWKFEQQWRPRLRVLPLVEPRSETVRRSTFLPVYYR